jgi:hypothetical protein
MAEVLTPSDKAAIATSRKRSLEIDKYNVDLALIEENAVSSPNADIIADLQAKLNESVAKIAAIDAEIASLTE